MTEQMQLEVKTAEIVDIRDLNVLEQERILYLAMTNGVAEKAKTIIADVKKAKTVEELNDAVAWCNERKESSKQIEGGFTFKVKSILHKKWQQFNQELDTYFDPNAKAVKDVMAVVTTKRAEIKARILAEEAKKNAKLLAKAEEKHEQKVQTLIDLGHEKKAMVVAKQPVAFTPVKIEMPKIKNAVWKKTYIITIEDIGALLTSISKNARYHSLVDQEKLIGRLESLARDLSGNMGDFKGIKCFEGENHALGGGK